MVSRAAPASAIVGESSADSSRYRGCPGFFRFFFFRGDALAQACQRRDKRHEQEAENHVEEGVEMHDFPAVLFVDMAQRIGHDACGREHKRDGHDPHDEVARRDSPGFGAHFIADDVLDERAAQIGAQHQQHAQMQIDHSRPGQRGDEEDKSQRGMQQEGHERRHDQRQRRFALQRLQDEGQGFGVAKLCAVLLDNTQRQKDQAQPDQCAGKVAFAPGVLVIVMHHGTRTQKHRHQPRQIKGQDLRYEGGADICAYHHGKARRCADHALFSERCNNQCCGRGAL